MSNTFNAYHGSGAAIIQVSNEFDLDHETKQQYQLILTANDMQGGSDPVGVTVDLTDEVEWGGKGVFVVSWVVAFGRSHAEVLIIPEDQDHWENDPQFSRKVWVERQEVVYTTVGAGPTLFSPNTLISRTNRSAIDEDTWVQRGTIDTAGQVNDMIDLIFSLDGAYGDDRQYDLTPNPNPAIDSWNSNSYAHGLLNALEASGPISVSVNLGNDLFPGWDKPLQLFEFGIEEE